MKKIIACILLAGSLAACQSSNPNDRMVAGGLVGAGTGAVIGGLATGKAGGALAGAAIGGLGGALIGGASQPDRNTRYCRATDEYGNIVRVRCPRQY